ncbi:MAG TPA: hypothetical protein PLN52_04410, partial [Opitutaceae bacterium]|nr:hypothetical protein [Opitutaceae bacterium]
MSFSHSRHYAAKWSYRWVLALTGVIAVSAASAETTPSTRAALAPLVVSATRSAASVEQLPITVERIGSERFRSSPALTLDATLRESAAFSLFRRSSGLTANPTAQGVSLRGLGPSGASR